MVKKVRNEDKMFVNLGHERGLYRTRFALLIVTTRGPEKEVAFVRETDNVKQIMEQLKKREAAPRLLALSDVIDSRASWQVREQLEQATAGQIVLVTGRDIVQKYRGETQINKALAELKRIQKGMPEEIPDSPVQKPKVGPPGSAGQELLAEMVRRGLSKNNK